jgi:hypothetical protein
MGHFDWPITKKKRKLKLGRLLKIGEDEVPPLWPKDMG